MSEKKLQDYLHFYMGCSIRRTSKSGEYEDDVKLDANEYYRVNCETYPYSIKPILRRLESITDEEWGKIESETSMMPEAQGYQAVKDSFFNPHINYRFYWPIVNEALQILRKRNVDVDGLLDSGLAIDSATLPKIN